MDKKNFRILSLTTENVMRLSAVNIPHPDRNVVVIAGENDAGKTCVLDSIEMLIGGGRAIPGEPVKRGAKSASIMATIGDEKVELICKRTITRDRGGRLTVTTADGGKPNMTSQALLDGLFNAIGFHPEEFVRMEPVKQQNMLRDLAGINTVEIDRKRDQLYDQRRDVSRDVKTFKAQLDGIQDQLTLARVPKIDTSDLESEIQRVRDENNERAKLESEHARALHSIELHEVKLDALEGQVKQLQIQISQLRSDKSSLTMQCHALLLRLNAMEFIDTTDLQDKLDSAKYHNTVIDLAQPAFKVERQYHLSMTEELELTRQIQALNESKAKMLAEAKWPIDGLGFDADGVVTFDGIPLDQQSESQKYKISVAISAALKPGLKVLLVRDGSILGDKRYQELVQLAKEHDLQLWIEYAMRDASDDIGGKPCIVIENGTVRNKDDVIEN